MEMKPDYRRKLIEVDLPLDVINAESAREKSIRHGHPSTLHLWWARRPLAACRAVIFASLVDDPVDCPDEFATEDTQRTERQRLHDLIKRLVKWENSSDANLLAEARYEIARSVARANDETAPTTPAAVLDYLNRQAKPIYDPFCGGGSIPLEAQRLGLRAVGSDLNPMAVLITKALIELPPKFADRPPANPDADPMGMKLDKGKRTKSGPWRGAAGLADDIRYYGRKMREMAWERIGHLYPKAALPDGSEATVIAWLWARTVPCPNPACAVAMPLLGTFQPSAQKNNHRWARPIVNRVNSTVSFEIQAHDGGVPKGGTVNRNGATCIACNGAVRLEYIRDQFRTDNSGQQMVAIVAESTNGRQFLSPNEAHIQAALDAEPERLVTGILANDASDLRVQGYGITEWHQLFTKRQMASLTVFSDLVSEAGEMAVRDGATEEYARILKTYLALAVGRLANGNSTCAVWERTGNFIAGTFVRNSISMVWDYPESNPFCTKTQNWMAQIDWVSKVVANLPKDVNHGVTYQADASTTIHAEQGPVIVTDPPYYDNICYADLSDYFYVWLRPILREVHPGLFNGMLTPKHEEMTAINTRFPSSRQRFEGLLSKTLELIRVRCSSEFPSSVFYAYKQQEETRGGRTSTGWETMLGALIDAGFQIVGTWPMRTERSGGVKANVNVLASSVVLVCRPRATEAPVATRRQFLDELVKELPQALDRLTHESHIAPVDLAQAAIGPGMRVYSKYSRVETFAGERVSVREALIAINQAIADYDKQEAGALDAETRFCVDWLQENGHRDGSYGTAETLAVAKNVVIDDLRDTHRLLAAERGQVRLLTLNNYEPERAMPREHGQPLPLTAWEGCFRIAYHLGRESEGGQGIAGASRNARQMGSDADSVERLARILYNYYDRKGDSANAVIFNNLVTAWHEITQRAQAPEQTELETDPDQSEISQSRLL